MAPIRWLKVVDDIALCKEIIAQCPIKPEQWEEVVAALSILFTSENSPVQLKEVAENVASC